MSVRNCQYPWHWMIVTHDGFVLPCGHGSKPIGNVSDTPVDELWNGATMQALRRSIANDEVHEVCRSTDCPYQQDHLAFPPQPEAAEIDTDLASAFDEPFYLETHPDVHAAVQRRQFTCGLEHFTKHGRAEGRAYRVTTARAATSAAKDNAVLALVDYGRRAEVVRCTPVDLVVQVSTVCNLRCVMCPHGIGAVENPHPMSAEIFGAIAGFVDRAARMIVSGLGEPMLAPAFWTLIERCADRRDTFLRANSNALLVTPERAARVARSGLKEISFSLDAAKAATYAKIRGASFERALAGIRHMVNARNAAGNGDLQIAVNMTLMAGNVHEAPAFVDLAADLGVDQVIFSQLFPFGNEPSWRVKRDHWEFVYAEQMLARVPALAAAALSAAQHRANARGIVLDLQSNTPQYLAPDADVEASA